MLYRILAIERYLIEIDNLTDSDIIEMDHLFLLIYHFVSEAAT